MAFRIWSGGLSVADNSNASGNDKADKHSGCNMCYKNKEVVLTLANVNEFSSLIGVVVGAIISGGFVMLNQYFVMRSEERRHRREMAVKAAMDYWKVTVEEMRHAAGNGVQIAVAPLDQCILHMIRVSELIERKGLTDAEMAVELSKMRKSSKAFFEAAKEEDKNEGRYPGPLDE